MSMQASNFCPQTFIHVSLTCYPVGLQSEAVISYIVTIRIFHVFCATNFSSVITSIEYCTYFGRHIPLTLRICSRLLIVCSMESVTDTFYTALSIVYSSVSQPF
jgi:hypothetical protein